MLVRGIVHSMPWMQPRVPTYGAMLRAIVSGPRRLWLMGWSMLARGIARSTP